MDDDPEAQLAELVCFREVEDFLFREADLLDEGRIAAWVDLFAEDGFYWVPGDATEERPDPAGAPFYGGVAEMRERFAAAGPEPGRLVSRTVSNVRIESRNANLGACEVSARFVLAEYRPGGVQRIHAGRYDYALLRRPETGLRIAAKKATVLDADSLDRPLRTAL